MGWCHTDVINPIDHIRRLNGIGRIWPLIGGLNIVGAGPWRLAQMVEALAALPIDNVVACHGAGEAAFEAFGTALGDKFVHGETGRTYLL